MTSTMKSVFVRGMWGEQMPSPYAKTKKEQGLGKNQIEVLNTWEHYPQPEPCLNFVAGAHNMEFFNRRGIPFLPFHEDRTPGASHWINKMLCIEQAFRLGYNEVVWLDWDCRMVKPLPAYYWDRLRDGQGFQAKLHWYVKFNTAMHYLKRKRCSNPLALPSGGCFYFRCHLLFRRAKELFLEVGPQSSDEVVFAALYHEMNGEWIEPSEFQRRGFDIFGYHTRRVYTVTTETVFVAGTFYESVGRLDYAGPKYITTATLQKRSLSD